MPRARGEGFVMLAPECPVEGCSNGMGKISFITCGHHHGPVEIKRRWLDAEPTRWAAIDRLIPDWRKR